MLSTDLQPILKEAGYRVHSLSRKELDITSSVQIEEVLDRLSPTVLVNTAVYHVEPCEDNPEQGYAVNALGPELLAKACARHGIELVQVSTCGLFGDEVREYHEYDPVVLKTVYARSKYEGERAVREFCPHAYVIRLGWLFGGRADHARNFVAARIREAEGKERLQSAGDKFGSPTYTGDVGRCLIELMNKKCYGLYHVNNAGMGSRADYVEACLRAAGCPKPVDRVDSSHFPRKADVPDCEAMTSYRLSRLGISPLPDWRSALEEYVRTHLLPDS